MSDFSIRFSVSPWLLLLLIPAFAVPLILHFCQKKEFRRTRNRIAALVLHLTALTLTIFALSGIYFASELPNERNELVILVDSSFSTGTAKDRTDKFVRELLEANDGRCKTSIVTFGYDQKIALEPGIYDADMAFKIYQEAASPDTTATDICAALEFCWDPVNDKSGEDIPVITYPESARIVLISDGIETDQKAQSVARRISMDGVRIDTAFFGGEQIHDMWISNVEYPDKRVEVGEAVNFSIEVKSSFMGKVTISLDDIKGDEVISPRSIEKSISIGSTSINFDYAFPSVGHHEVRFTLSCDDDVLTKNNVYYTYVNIDEEFKALVINKYSDEANGIKEALKERIESGQVALEIMNVDTDGDRIPKTTTQMQEYDEIILSNIAYSDFDDSFWKNLQTYVKSYGGGMFTIGGVERDNDGKPIYFTDEFGNRHAEPHAYNEEDMKGTIYQDMLPVEVTDYVPPIGLMIIIDCSGSMSDKDFGGDTLVDIAIKGALACVDKLSTRDYVGVTMLSSNYETQIEMTPMSKKAVIKNAIRDIANSVDGGTAYTPSLRAAGRALAGLPAEVQRKHILFLSDGAPADTGWDFYNEALKEYDDPDNRITMTMVCMDGSGRVDESVNTLCRKMNTEVHYFNKELSGLPDVFWEDLDFDEKLYGAIEKAYNISVSSQTDTLKDIKTEELEKIKLGGFFTTCVKGYNDVENPLMAQYVPLYAQWRYGEGRVGSFMCDIGGLWGSNLLDSEAGKKLVDNIILGLMPTVDLSVNTISAKFIEDNYRTQVSVYNFDPEAEAGQKLVAYVQYPKGSEQGLLRYDLSELSLGGNRFTFENKIEGVYTVTIIKVPKNFNPFTHDVNSAENLGSAILRTYRAFSYSKEYLTEADSFTNGKNLMITLSSRKDVEGEEKFAYDAEDVLEGFDLVVETVDPRTYLYIAAIVLLLLGVIVRKFKFKWPHEILAAKRINRLDKNSL